jgi:hypothetical protein
MEMVLEDGLKGIVFSPLIHLFILVVSPVASPFNPALMVFAKVRSAERNHGS